MSTLDRIMKLTGQLYPTGRAWKMIPGGYREKLHRGLGASEKRFYDDATSILDSAIPDNENFTADDATDWERRLGLITNTSLSLSIRKAAILRKMNYGLDVRPRGSYRFVERELQAAGFNVYVIENRFDDGIYGWETRTPQQLIEDFYVANQFSDSSEMGVHEFGDDSGGYYYGVIANTLDNSVDILFDHGDIYSNTFFIGGQNPGEFVDVDASRETEFRQLVLKLKPAHSIAFILINFV